MKYTSMLAKCFPRDIVSSKSPPPPGIPSGGGVGGTQQTPETFLQSLRTGWMIQEKDVEQLFFSYAGSDRKRRFFERHSHRGIELLYIAAGSCIMIPEKAEMMSGRTGDIFVIPPHASHERNASENCKSYFVVFEQEPPGFVSNWRKINTANDPLIRQWFENLASLNNIYAPDEAAAILQALLLRIGKIEYSEQALSKAHPGLKKACSYINMHYGEKISVRDIAGIAGVSPNHLNYLFQANFGTGPLRYLNDVRMKIARKLLLNRFYNISEVAQLCGFQNVHYFSRAFKLFHSVTPSAYRTAPASCADTGKILSHTAPRPE